MEPKQIRKNRRRKIFPSGIKTARRLAGEILPFILVGLLVWGGYALWDSIYSEDEHDEQILEERQEALDKNWEDFRARKPAQNSPIDLTQFELSLCPFVEEFSEGTTPEEAGMVCGYITAPFDHHHLERGSVSIPIAIWPSYDDNYQPDALFISQGGPGGSTLDTYPDIFSSSSLRTIRDLVFVDHRGTRYAEPSLLCPEELDEWVENTPEDEEENGDDYSALRSCRERLENEGIDLSVFTTEQIARDFNFVRQVLGYEKINFYGVSYGSHVGQYLAVYYPDTLRSLILDGVAPLPLEYLNHSLSKQERILEKLQESCGQDPNCQNQYPEIIKQLDETLIEFEQDPIQITLSDPDSKDVINDKVTGEVLYSFLIFWFYLEDGYATAPFLISQLGKKTLIYTSLLASG